MTRPGRSGHSRLSSARLGPAPVLRGRAVGVRGVWSAGCGMSGAGCRVPGAGQHDASGPAGHPTSRESHPGRPRQPRVPPVDNPRHPPPDRLGRTRTTPVRGSTMRADPQGPLHPGNPTAVPRTSPEFRLWTTRAPTRQPGRARTTPRRPSGEAQHDVSGPAGPLHQVNPGPDPPTSPESSLWTTPQAPPPRPRTAALALPSRRRPPPHPDVPAPPSDAVGRTQPPRPFPNAPRSAVGRPAAPSAPDAPPTPADRAKGPWDERPVDNSGRGSQVGTTHDVPSPRRPRPGDHGRPPVTAPTRDIPGPGRRWRPRHPHP